MTNLRQHVKKQRYYFANKGPSSQGYGFSSGHMCIWELDYSESWAPKNLCFWTIMLKKTLEILLDCKEIQPVHPKGDQSWVFSGRTDVEAEIPILWSPDAKSWLTGKDPDAGKDWRQGGEGDNRGWDGWMASPTQWTWIWENWEMVKDIRTTEGAETVPGKYLTAYPQLWDWGGNPLGSGPQRPLEENSVT